MGIAVFKVFYGKIKPPYQKRVADFLRAASPVKTFGADCHCQRQGAEKKRRISFQIKPENIINPHQVQKSADNLKDKHPGKCGVGDKIGQSVQKIKVRPLLVKHVPVGHFSVKKRFSHRKVAVGVVPVVAWIQEGRAGGKKH